MKPYKKSPAAWAASWALGLSAGYIIGPLIVYSISGVDDLGGKMATKVVTGMVMFPVLFVGFWLWGIKTKKDPMMPSSTKHSTPYQSRTFPKKPNVWNYVAIGAGIFMLLFLFIPQMVSGTMANIYYLGAAFWVGVIIYCSINISRAKVYAKSDETQPNESTVKQDRVKLENSVDRPASEHKGRVIAVRDFSYSGPLPKIEVKPVDKSLPSDETFYEKAFNELESGDKKVGLWAKVFAESQGNESLAKANYLKIRSGQLATEYRQTLFEEERTRQEEIKKKEEEQRRREKEKRIEIEKQRPDEQLRSLAKKMQSQPWVEIAKDLVNKLGGTFKDSDASWFSSSKTIVNLYGKTHEFQTEYDFAEWVKNDIAPHILKTVAASDSPSIDKSTSLFGVIETGRDGRFIAYSIGTVLDTNTNLMWAAKDNGKNVDWVKADSYCKNYRGGGYTNWRMPTRDELEKLYDSSKTNQNGYHLTEFIELTTYSQWASETQDSNAVQFDFRLGYWCWLRQSLNNGYRALPVRSAK